jgi:galactose mutarotase-like enzyme
MPVAVGWHPWFRRWGDEPISVAVPAEAVLETTADLIPTGAITPVTELTDLREATDLRDRRLDHTYVGVEGACVVAWTDLELSIEASPLRSVVVHSTPTAVCVEPQTAWPDAIRLDAEGVDTGLVGLSAGESFVVQSRWSWRGSSAGRDLS